MKALKYIEELNVAADSTAWQLLRRTHAPVVLGILMELLYRSEKRTISSGALVDKVERILNRLSVIKEGWSNPSRYYINQWKESGYLAIIYGEDDNEEQFELTKQCISALEYVDRLNIAQVSVNESRLSNVMDLIKRLALETDANPQTKLKALQAQKAEIEEQIDNIHNNDGIIETIDNRKAVEQAREILRLIGDLGADFKHVREDIVDVLSQFWANIMSRSESSTKDEILTSLFEKLDSVRESSSGQSFFGFWELLNNNKENSAFQSNLSDLYGRPFFKSLKTKEKHTLRSLISNLRYNATIVNDAHAKLASALQAFVDEVDFEEKRYFSNLLRECQKIAIESKDIHNSKDKCIDINLVKMEVQAIGSIEKIWDPAESNIDGTMVIAESPDINFDDIANSIKESEINFKQIKIAINKEVLKGNPVSIAEIIKANPIEQGLGTVVGYISIAQKNGILTKEYETVDWVIKGDIKKHAKIPKYFFYNHGKQNYG
jgi:hypothetical protein